MRRIVLLLLASLSILTVGPVPSLHAQAYKVTNLLSDGSVPATTMDPSFLNPWGISVSPTWWISTANSGENFIVNATTDAIVFRVLVPPASASSMTGTPAGSVTTSGASGMILSNGTKASFLFSTLDGTISGWNNLLGMNLAVPLIAINNASAGASYPGLALLNVNATTSYILAPNFGTANKVEVYDQTFKPTKLSGSFTDPNLPAGYAPWSIHILNNQIWVAYAQRSASAPYLPVPASAPASLMSSTPAETSSARRHRRQSQRPLGRRLRPLYRFRHLLRRPPHRQLRRRQNQRQRPQNLRLPRPAHGLHRQVLVYATLWDLLTGGRPLAITSVSGGIHTSVYFTAGLAGETHGLFASIANTTPQVPRPRSASAPPPPP